MQKIFKLLFPVVLMFTILIGVNAETTAGKITIDNAVSGETYKIYKILELESYDKAKGYYSYKVATEFKDFVESADIQGKYLSTNNNGYVTWVGDSSDDRIKAFADLAKAYVESNKITATKSVKATSNTVEFTDLKLGYYLVTTTLGSIASLDTTNNEVTIKEKNSTPTVDKEVAEDDISTHIGDTVNYTVTITVGKGAKNYVLHDTMSSGLTFNTNSISVKVGDNVVDSSNYILEAGTNDYTFELTFLDNYLNTLSENSKIVITYSATVNTDAYDYNTVTNTAKLTYGDDPDTYSEDTVTSYLWSLNFFKFTGENKALAGAVFKLCYDKDGTNCVKLVNLGNNTYRLAMADETDFVSTVTTDETGLFTIKGLDDGTYYLIETEAPNGYNKLQSPIVITIGAVKDSNGVYSMVLSVDGTNVAAEADGTFKISIENKTGSLLPITGGMGTTIIYILGMIFVIGFGTTLIIKKRNN